MNTQHPQLIAGRWKKIQLCEQLAHVGSEVERAINWKEKGNIEYSQFAFFRCLELLDLTIACDYTYSQLKELTRLRECLVDYFFGKNSYSSSAGLWRKYFYAFNYITRLGR